MNKLVRAVLVFICLMLFAVLATNAADDERIEKVRLMAAGDIIFHLPQIANAYNQDTGEYDFSQCFAKVKKHFEKADIVAGNLEGTFCEERLPLSGYPLFNAPNSALDAIKDAGFNVLSTCNNHSLDSGSEGVAATIDKLKARGIAHFGTSKNGEANYLILEVNNITIGFLGYSFYFNGFEYSYSEERLASLVNTLDASLIENDIKRLKLLGADVVVVYPHWGVEYDMSADESQRSLAASMVKWGADVILGSHPHVLQETQILQRGGKDKFVIYSMGNFISNQRYETLGKLDVETGVVIDIIFSKNMKTGDTLIESVDSHIIWVNRFSENNKRHYEVVFAEDFEIGGELRSTVNAETLERILNAMKRGNNLLYP